MRKLLFALVLSVLVACEGEVTSEQHIARAKEYMEAPDYAAASIELQNALKQDPNLAEARWLLGQIHFDSGNMPAAEHEFMRAQDLGWSADDILPTLARTNLAQGRFDDVLAMEPEGLSPGGAASLLSQQAIAAMANRQPEQAWELLAQAEGEDPQSLEIKLARATVLVNEQKYEAALKELEPVLEVAPEEDRAWRLRAQTLVRLGRPEEARDALDKSIEYSAFAPSDRVVRALINIQSGDYESAQADADALREIAPGRPSLHYVQGLLHAQNRDYLSTIASLTQVEPLASQYPLIAYYLAVAYQFEQDFERSVQYAREYVALQPDQLQARKLLAIALVQTGGYEEVEVTLGPLLEASPNDLEAQNILANALLLDDQAYRALVIYRKIHEFDPDREIVPLGQEGRIVTGDSVETPGKTLNTAVRSPNFPQNRILEIKQYLEKEDYAAAIETTRAFQNEAIESKSPHQVLGKIYIMAGRSEDAQKTFENVLKRNPGDPFANLNLAQMAKEAGDIDAARGYYEDILKYHLNHLEAMTLLAGLDALENNPRQLEQRLKKIIEVHPEAVEPRLNLASFYMAARTPEKVPPLFAPLSATQRSSPRVLELSGMAFMMEQDYALAVETYERLVQVQPGEARNHYLLALALNANDDEDRAKAEFQKALAADENYEPALLSLARLALIDHDRKRLDQYTARLVALNPDSEGVGRLQAAIASSDGDHSAAVAHAKRTFKAAPSSRTAMELVGYLRAEGSDDEAHRHLEAWIAENPGDTVTRLSLANWLQFEGDVSAAKDHYEKIIEAQETNVVALNNLAWHLRETNPETAFTYAQRAATLAPNNPSILDTLALIQLELGDREGAGVSIQQALQQAPDAPSIRYHAAQVYLAQGNQEAAIGILEKLTAAGAAGFPERDEASELLASLRK